MIVCQSAAGAGAKIFRSLEHGHQSQESSVASAAEPDSGRVDLQCFCQIFSRVDDVRKVFSAHMPVDPGPEITAVPRAFPVIRVQDKIALFHQDIVEHVLSLVTRPALMSILEITGAVDKDDGRPPRSTERELRPFFSVGYDVLESRRVNGDIKIAS